MNNFKYVLSVLMLCLLPPVVSAEQADGDTLDLDNLIRGGSFDLSFRYRYEFVDDDDFSKDAKASTVRSRLSLQSGEYRDVDFFIEVDDVHEFYGDNYNAGGGNTPSRTQFPVVADPEGTEFNQVYMDYNGFEDLSARLGRQRINFDNQRFIGGVGWRQNEQTYEGLKLGYVFGSDARAVTVDYAYITRVRRIFGDDVSAGKHDQDGTHFLHAAGEVADWGKWSGYYYLIDNKDDSAFSTATVGARWVGRYPINEKYKVRYALEFANQRDVENNPVDYSANYWRVDGGLLFDIYDIGLGWEVLQGDKNSLDNESFRTPLATLHAFNGWADKFLTTPAAGLDDRFVALKATPGDFIVQVRYHDFQAEDGSDNYGDEIDLEVSYKYNERLKLSAYLASFDGSSGFSDTTKVWLQFLFTL